MSTLEYWLDTARANRGDDLIYFNFLFETASKNSLIPRETLAAFTQYLADESFDPGVDTHTEFLSEFTTRFEQHRMSGPAIPFPDDGVVSIFSAEKFGRIFGKTEDLEKLVEASDAGRPFERHAVAGAITEYIRHLALALKKRAAEDTRETVRVSTTPSGLRSKSSVRTPETTRFSKTEMIWCTRRRDVAVLYQDAPPSEALARALRRVLGLPTSYKSARPTSKVSEVLGKIFFRVHFSVMEDAPAYPAARGLRKPTVFSEGFCDVYATYWGPPQGDGWGRTVTLCAGDAEDGRPGSSEAVVLLDELVYRAAKSVGDLPARPVPEIKREDEVRVGEFAQRRHVDVLQMIIT